MPLSIEHGSSVTTPGRIRIPLHLYLLFQVKAGFQPTTRWTCEASHAMETSIASVHGVYMIPIRPREENPKAYVSIDELVGSNQRLRCGDLV